MQNADGDVIALATGRSHSVSRDEIDFKGRNVSLPSQPQLAGSGGKPPLIALEVFLWFLADLFIYSVVTGVGDVPSHQILRYIKSKNLANRRLKF
jgi:hypothetical protein